jgi:multisubunit Na+/H+ antiporter MnhG subunit
LLPVALVALYYMVSFDLGPVRAAWYLFLLVTGNATGILTTACLIVLAAITGSVAAILLARARHGDAVAKPRGGRRKPQEQQPPIFGPGGHAGPGAIGQARSTLGR